MACGLEIKPGSKVKLHIEGDVSFKGGINCDGIRVPEGAELEITGQGHLYCSGNNEHERFYKGKSDALSGLLGFYYGDKGKVSNVSTDADFAEYSQTSNGNKNTGGSGIGYAQHRAGNIIITGDCDENDKPLLTVTALGYGHMAFGIGGGDGVHHKFTNVIFDELRGGYGTICVEDQSGNRIFTDLPSTHFISERRCYPKDSNTYHETAENLRDDLINDFIKLFSLTEAEAAAKADDILQYIPEAKRNFGPCLEYGKTEAEGGCAIGIGGDPDLKTDFGTIDFTNVEIKKAYGGSKTAAIGGFYWAAPTINITDCTFENIYGGNAATAIGGSRFNEDPTSDVKINIQNSTLNNIFGGDFAAAIGSGYNTYTLEMCSTSSCDINIDEHTTLKNIYGGLNAAGIGTGYHQSLLTGDIKADVTNVHAGDCVCNLDWSALSSEQQSAYKNKGSEGKNDSGKYLYADNQYGTLSKPQNVGYGILYTHGANYLTPKIDGVTYYNLAGRECVNTDYLANNYSFDYDLRQLTSSEKDLFETWRKSEENITKLFEGFDKQFTENTALKVGNIQIENPRAEGNNLSKGSSYPTN